MRQSPLFNKIDTANTYLDEAEHATIKGVSLKTTFLLAITITIAVVTAIFLPKIASDEKSLSVFIGVLIGAAIVGFISVLVGRLSERASKYAGLVYSLCEGLFLGALTRIAEELVPGVGFIAMAVTLTIFAVMLLLYSIGIFRSGSRLRKALIAIAFVGLAVALVTTLTILIMNLAGVQFDKSILPILIIVEIFFLLYGVITLIFNFDEANAIVQTGASKNAEWCVALGLQVSLIYIYVEVIRLIILIAASSSKN